MLFQHFDETFLNRVACSSAGKHLSFLLSVDKIEHNSRCINPVFWRFGFIAISLLSTDSAFYLPCHMSVSPPFIDRMQIMKLSPAIIKYFGRCGISGGAVAIKMGDTERECVGKK